MTETPKDPGEERLLPGERQSLSSGNLEDIRLWAAVYGELYGFKEKLLQEVADQRDRIESPGKPELDNDRVLLEREAERLKRRLQFWEEKLRKQGAS